MNSAMNTMAIPFALTRILERTEEQKEVVDEDDRLVIVGFGLLFLSLICLGSWPALLRLASTDPRVLPSSSLVGQTTQRWKRNQRQYQHQELSRDLHPFEEGGVGKRADHTDNNDVNDTKSLNSLSRQENDGVMIFRHHHRQQNYNCGHGPYQDHHTLSTDTDNGFYSDEHSRREHSHQHHHSPRRVPRDARLAYLDYAIAYTISSLIPLLLMMFFKREDAHFGSASTFSSSSSSSSLLPISAMVGGVLLCLGNMSLQWSTTVYGAPLTTVVAIQASLTVTVGTTINYILQPQLTYRPKLLLLGVLLFVTAIGVATKAHNLYGENYQDLEQHPLDLQRGHYQQEKDDVRRQVSSSSPPRPSPDIEMMSLSSDKIDGSDKQEDKIATDTTIVSQNQVLDLNLCHDCEREQQLHDDDHHHHRHHQRALWIAIFGGCCFGFFSPAFNIAVNDPFGFSSANGSGGLSVPVANLWFSLAFTISSVAGNGWLMISPPLSSGLKPIRNIYRAFCIANPSSSYSVRDNENDRDVLADSNIMCDRCCTNCSSSSQALAMWAGFVCGMANLLQFQGGSIVGFATADLVQAYPIVSTLWDVMLFGEFRSSSFYVNHDGDDEYDDHQLDELPPLERSSTRRKMREVVSFLIVMYVLYFGGITSIVMSFAK